MRDLYWLTDEQMARWKVASALPLSYSIAMTYPAFRHVVGLVIGAPFLMAAQDAPPVPQSDRAPEIRMTGDRVVLPIVMVREFPFIDAEVMGVPGKLMFDTGSEQALLLNDHRVPLQGGVDIGSGVFGSGQRFQLRMNQSVGPIKISDLGFARATQVASQDATMLENITPDFLGWLGYGFIKNYSFKLDYDRSRITFYSGAPSQYLAGEKVVTDIPFETRKLPNHPLIHVRIGGVDAIAGFDTGQYGSLFTDKATKARWLKEGVIKRSGEDPDEYDLSGFEAGGRYYPAIKNLYISTDPDPSAKAIGLTETTKLGLGYGFLRNYKTVLDFNRKRIYLLKRSKG